MKYLLMPIAAVVVAILFAFNAKDEVKDQTEQIKSLRLGKYTRYEVTGNKDDGFAYNPGSEIELLEVIQEKTFTEQKGLVADFGLGPKQYMPDNMAFPTTLVNIEYQGNPKMQEEIGYVLRKPDAGSSRIYVVDGLIYQFAPYDYDPDNPETFKPFSVYVHTDTFYSEESDGNEEKDGEKKKKKKSSFLKRLTQEMANVNSGGLGGKKLMEMKAVEKGMEYLEKALAKQKEVYPAWAKKPFNAQRLKYVEQLDADMTVAIRKYNEAYKKSAAWKRIQENNRIADAAAKANNVTISNGTGKDIYIYEEGSYNGSRLGNGSSSTYDCKKSYYYTFDGNSDWRKGSSIGGISCGATVTVR